MARSTWSRAPALASVAMVLPQPIPVEPPVSPAYIALRVASLVLLAGGAFLTFTAFGDLVTPPKGVQPANALVQWVAPPTPTQITRGLAGEAFGLLGALVALGMWVVFPRRSERPPLLAILEVANLGALFIATIALMMGLDTLATWVLKPTYEQRDTAMLVVLLGFIGLVGLVTLVNVARIVWKLRQRTE